MNQDFFNVDGKQLCLGMNDKAFLIPTSIPKVCFWNRAESQTDTKTLDSKAVSSGSKTVNPVQCITVQNAKSSQI